MASAENVQLAANFGLFMLSAGGLGLLLGTTLGRSGLISRITQPRDLHHLLQPPSRGCLLLFYSVLC